MAARLELHGSRVQGKVLDANTMRTVALVRGSLAQGVVVEEVQGGEPMQVLPPGGMVSKTISLDALGGLRMPLLWSALHDSLLFAVPTGIPLRPLHLQADDKQGHGHELLPLSIKVRCVLLFIRHATHMANTHTLDLYKYRMSAPRGTHHTMKAMLALSKPLLQQLHSSSRDMF